MVMWVLKVKRTINGFFLKKVLFAMSLQVVFLLLLISYYTVYDLHDIWRFMVYFVIRLAILGLWLSVWLRLFERYAKSVFFVFDTVMISTTAHKFFFFFVRWVLLEKIPTVQLRCLSCFTWQIFCFGIWSLDHFVWINASFTLEVRASVCRLSFLMWMW